MRNARHARKDVPQPGLRLLDVAAQGNPGQRFTGLLEDVIRHAPLTAVPVFKVQWLAPAGQIVEVAAGFGLADLLVDRTLPAGLSRTSHCAGSERTRSDAGFALDGFAEDVHEPRQLLSGADQRRSHYDRVVQSAGEHAVGDALADNPSGQADRIVVVRATRGVRVRKLNCRHHSNPADLPNPRQRLELTTKQVNEATARFGGTLHDAFALHDLILATPTAQHTG